MTRRWPNVLPRPLAFVFAGGANLGSIQVEMLKAWRDAGLSPDHHFKSLAFRTARLPKRLRSSASA